MKTLEEIKKNIENHYHGQLSIFEITKDDNTVWYKANVKSYFIPLHKHVLIDADFDDKWIKLYVDLKNII